MEKKPGQSINIKFTKTPDYKIIAATGAFGGPTPQGEILCNFFIEYKEPPEFLEIEIGERGGIVKETEKIANDYYNRELQIGVLLRPDIAKSVGDWLISHADKVMAETQPLIKA